MRFYHPRWDNWGEHFKLNDSTIEPLTSIGQVTARILGFNDQHRLLERQLLIEKKKYPSPLAIRRMNAECKVFQIIEIAIIMLVVKLVAGELILDCLRMD